MKKLTALLAALMILLGIFCNGALAASNDYVIKNGVLTAYKGNGGDVVIPEGVTEIASEVFRFKCITSLTFPSTLKVIGAGAFSGVEGLDSITVPASVQKIGNGAFRGNTNGQLKEIKVESGSKYFKSVNGVLLSKNGKSLLCYPVGKKDASYTIPGTVQVITTEAFANTAVKALVIPASVKTIESYAFYVSCLQELTIPATVKKFHITAIDTCRYLQKLTVKNDQTEVVDSWAFTAGSNKLKIYAPASSPIKKIAKNHNISFKAIGNEEPGISSIKLNKAKATLTRTADRKKPTLQLKATVDPAEVKSPKLKWTSSDKKIAKVDKNGKVTALKAGKVTITCTAADNGEVKATCTVTVKDKAVKSITLDAKKATLKKGKTLQLKVSAIKPQDAVNQKLKWTSSDETVATVDKNGKVTAVGKGTCTVTCSLQDGGKAKATVKITVK